MSSAQAMLSLLQRITVLQPQDPETDNDPLEKPVGVSETTTIDDTNGVSVTNFSPSTLKWGGQGVPPGWLYGTGQWG